MSNKFPKAEYKDGLLEFESKEDAEKAASRLNSLDPSVPSYTEIAGNYVNKFVKNAFKGLGIGKLEEVLPEYGNHYRSIGNAVVPNNRKITEEEKQTMKLYSESSSEEELEKMWRDIKED